MPFLSPALIPLSLGGTDAMTSYRQLAHPRRDKTCYPSRQRVRSVLPGNLHTHLYTLISHIEISFSTRHRFRKRFHLTSLKSTRDEVHPGPSTPVSSCGSESDARFDFRRASCCWQPVTSSCPWNKEQILLPTRQIAFRVSCNT